MSEPITRSQAVRQALKELTARDRCPCCGAADRGDVRNRLRRGVHRRGQEYMTSCQACWEQDAGGESEGEEE